MCDQIVSDGPVEATARIESLDVLRGFAVLGILVMNIQSFSMIGAAYMNPTAWGTLEGAEGIVWYLSHLLADSKFFTLFSMMFGAGVVLMAERRSDKGMSAASMHSYLFWYGDILVPYAVCGTFVFLAWRLSSRWLLAIAALLVLFSVALTFLLSWSLAYMPESDLADLRQSIWSPKPEQIQHELAVHRGPWLPQFYNRVVVAIAMQTLVLFLMCWSCCGMMMIGMALYKSGVLTAQRSSRFYASMAIIGLATGLPLIALGVHWKQESNWDFEYSMFSGSLPNYFGSMLVALAYIGGVVLLIRSRVGNVLKNTLAPVGRMALTNYLGQTIICTTFFYGHGLARFGEVSRVEQFGIVLAVWIFQIIASVLWMRRYRFGPVEYVWRTMTYLKRP